MHRSVTPCSFTILFDMPHKDADDHEETIIDSYTYYSSSSSCSSPVDCVLSLGPTSTRCKSPPKRTPSAVAATTSCMPAIRWDIFSQSNKTSSTVPARNSGNGSGSLSGCGGDPLLARRCVNCDTTSTPLWRNGPRGPKSLCNACGIRYKKEERRVAATMAPCASTSPSPIAAMETQKPQHAMVGYAFNQHDNHPWGYTASQRNSLSSLSSSNNEFRFIRGYDGESAEDSALPYLSWCLNVPQPRAEYLHHY